MNSKIMMNMGFSDLEKFPSNMMMVRKVFTLLVRHHPWFNILIGFLLIGIIAISDFLTGHQIAFLLFYIIPISLLTWFVGRWIGMIASFFISIFIYFIDLTSGYAYSHPFISVVNFFIILSSLATITLTLAILKSKLDYEKGLARIDNLTGAVNSRLFLELLQMEMDRLQRYKHPFTLLYLDLDNFKVINDRFGHPIGDELLIRIVSYAKKHLRKVDIIARLGGDEFAVLLPETSNESAKIAVKRLQNGLLEEMNQRNWPITFSIGVVTCSKAQCTVNELLKVADNLMYTVKQESKNSIKYALLGD